ncbi:putative PEP-binding protein [Phytohabitans rumicis]|uniref:Phosphoenolpyruvate-protein phosphotransferase n=1 Tax=Phytohabitans rumicis TaxID=1076125 RepID=A0A6V8L2F2_9ACTN|nr:putative PEP-binding protein [Phytohabitans rumicis]GFJ88277.1 hypothetical protein Prum_019190 [Phytohabitans rumicis]
MRYEGVAGSPGVGLGRIRRVDPVAGTAPSTVDAHAVEAAFDAVAALLRKRADELRAGGHTEPADIMDTTALIADDPDLRSAAVSEVRAGVPADRAVTAAAARYAGVLAALPDPTLAGRAADVRQVGRRVVAALTGDTGSTVEGPVVLVGHELGADDLLDAADGLAGAVSTLGGPNAHVGIVARALGVPLVFGIEPAAAGGALAIVDGAVLVVDPTADEQRAARAAMRAAAGRRADLAAGRTLPAVTRDGHAVTLLANVATPGEAAAAVAGGAAGAGLVRTELPFLAATDWPDEAAHAAALRPVLAPLAGRVATVRALDFAPDKLPPFLIGRSVTPPPDALAAQFRAIVAAGAGTELRVMLPMVASAAQLRAARPLLAAPVPLGAMVELAAAVEDIDALAAAADFLSIGTNDLTAALLGLDRQDPRLTPARAADPVVLRAIAAVVRAGDRHGRPVSVCGDAAADASVIPLLLGVGCTTLSVTPSALDAVRALVRSLDLAECRARAAVLLA